MPRSNETDESMDFDDSQSTVNSTPGGPGGGRGPPPSLTTIYAEQYVEAQRILQDGGSNPEAVNRLTEILATSVKLCKQEKKVQESYMGSAVLSICAQVSRNQAIALDTNLSAFDIQAFSDGILNYVRDREVERLDWSLLGKRAKTMFKRSPAMSYMYGSFKPTELPRKEPKERVVRQRAVRAEKKEPEKVTAVNATDEGNDKAVQHLKKVLKNQFKRNGYQPISFFECVLDPVSFHRTVENIFHLSFLMKNNMFSIKQENGGLPYIHMVAPNEVNELQKGKKLQCIVSISQDMWQKLVTVFEIKQAMVPPMT